jgi:hypothetical protein
MSKYVDTLLKLAKSLVAQYDVIFDQSGDRGDSREKAVIAFLEKVNADKYGFSKGEVFDSNGDSSGEVDVIIHDRLFSPVFRDGSGKILAPVESTYGIIEVKSTLTITELESSIAKLKRYNDLVRREAADGEAFITPDVSFGSSASIQIKGTDNERINVIFAYKNDIKRETLLGMARQCDFLDLIVVPGEFCYFGRKRRAGWGLQNNGQDLVSFLSLSESAVALWAIYLQILLSRSRLVALDRDRMFLEFIRESKIMLP